MLCNQLVLNSMDQNRKETYMSTKNRKPRRIWILDLEGVVAPTKYVKDPIEISTSFTNQRIPERVVQWIKAERTVAGTEFFWLSLFSDSKEHDRVTKVMGVARFPSLSIPGMATGSPFCEALEKFFKDQDIQTEDTVIWVNSDMDPFSRRWAESVGIHTICPDPEYGISQVIDQFFDTAESMPDRKPKKSKKYSRGASFFSE